jgi:hypothetical protein
MSEVRKWLETVGLAQYADAFARQMTSTLICSLK